MNQISVELNNSTHNVNVRWLVKIQCSSLKDICIDDEYVGLNQKDRIKEEKLKKAIRRRYKHKIKIN